MLYQARRQEIQAVSSSHTVNIYCHK